MSVLVCASYNSECTQKEGEHIGSPLHKIIQWFKTMTTNEYIKMAKQNILPPFEKRIWQRNYHDHIIRNEGQGDRFLVPQKLCLKQ